MRVEHIPVAFLGGGLTAFGGSATLGGAVLGLSFLTPGALAVITALSQCSFILFIFRLSFSSSTKKGPIAFSPTNFIKVPKASAEVSLTLGSKIKENER